MDIKINNLTTSCTIYFNGVEDLYDIDDPDNVFLHRCNVNYRPVSSTFCYLKLESSCFSDYQSSYMVVPVDDKECLLFDSATGESCMLYRSSAPEDIADDMSDIVDDEELAQLLAIIVLPLFDLNKGQFTFSSCLPNTVKLPSRS